MDLEEVVAESGFQFGGGCVVGGGPREVVGRDDDVWLTRRIICGSGKMGVLKIVAEGRIGRHCFAMIRLGRVPAELSF
jgi:hypothetical protein